jgi:hypothetical protein
MIRMLGSPNPPAVPPADGDDARRDRPDDRGAVAMSAAPAYALDPARCAWSTRPTGVPGPPLGGFRRTGSITPTHVNRRES